MNKKIEFEPAGFPKYSFQKKKIYIQECFWTFKKNANALAKYQMQYFCGKKNLIFHMDSGKNNTNVCSCADFIFHCDIKMVAPHTSVYFMSFLLTLPLTP